MWEKEVRFAKSARKHRIGKAHALFVLENHEPVTFLSSYGEDQKLLWIAQDDRGLELEIVAVKLAENILVIHVMPRNFRMEELMAESQYVLGKDIDLDKEVIRDSQGKRITSKRAERIVEEVIAQAVGRPSLTGPSKVSPEIKARVPEKLKRALQKEAKRQGQTTSAVIRQALEEYLDTA